MKYYEEERKTLCRSVCPRKREREKKGWLGATRNYPLDSRPDTKAWTGRLCASEYPISTSEKLFVHRGQRPVCVYLHARIRERRALAYNALSRTHTRTHFWMNYGDEGELEIIEGCGFFRDKDNVFKGWRDNLYRIHRWIRWTFFSWKILSKNNVISDDKLNSSLPIDVKFELYFSTTWKEDIRDTTKRAGLVRKEGGLIRGEEEWDPSDPKCFIKISE